MIELTQSQLKEVLHYEPETGLFTWLKKPAQRVNIGDIAGCKHVKGYIHIVIFYKQYKAHRLAFLYMEGSFPPKDVDHLNNIGIDNRWCNIVRATVNENMKNKEMYKRNTSGFCGVAWKERNQKWQASIGINKRRKYLGIFTTHYAACYARHCANIKYGFSKRHGNNHSDLKLL